MLPFLLRDGCATLLTFGIASSWLKVMDILAHRGTVEPTLSGKIIHIGTGPLFILCWPLFSPQPWARGWAAIVPLVITLRFAAIGLGWIRDPAAVQSMTRHNCPGEMLRGPLMYGLVFVACTLIFWRHSPVGMLALMMLCGGDGLADIVGRRWGRHKLPWSAEKSWVGSTAMFLGSTVFGSGALALFNQLGYFQPPLTISHSLGTVVIIAAAVTLVESLPFRDIDNFTLTLVAILMGQILIAGGL